LSPLQKLRIEQRLLEESGDTARWIISYADFITLLFAFFVVMYSISSVNDGKFRVLSDSMVAVFNEPSHRPVPIDLGGSPDLDEPASAEMLEEVALEQDDTFDPEVLPFDVDATATVAERVTAAMAPLIEDTDVIVRDGQQWLEVELPSELLFASGRAVLNVEAGPIINSMARALRGVKTPIRVEGFTDNVPLHGGRFGSNWQLSAARAAALVDRFTSAGIDPQVMSAIGFGEFHPVAVNDNAEGRRKNRRVVVAIAKHESVAAGGPAAGANSRSDSLPPQTLRRVTKLPGAIGIL
jgi:chemotaxis protein MotB